MINIIKIFYFVLFSTVYLLNSEEENKIQRSIGLIHNETFRGEREFAERVKIACENLNWKILITNPDSYENLDQEFDWVFTLAPNKKGSTRYDDYLMLFDPERHYFGPNGDLSENYLGYAGYLTTYEKIHLLLIDVKFEASRIYPKRWYPTAQYRNYQKVNPTRLFYMICNWGNRRNQISYIQLMKRLANTSYTNFFGNPALGMKYGKAYKGDIEFDGESVINKISDMGVCLVLHSNTHIKHAIPSGRIFEAAAASSVIISDLNPFVIKNFGDSVLYVNHTLSGEEMFKQIDKHMKWIQTNPDKALKMAKKSYQIYIDHFLLENQLLDFENFRESLHSVDGN